MTNKKDLKSAIASLPPWAQEDGAQVAALAQLEGVEPVAAVNDWFRVERERRGREIPFSMMRGNSSKAHQDHQFVACNRRISQAHVDLEGE